MHPRVLDLGPGRAEVLWWVKASLTLPEGKVPWWNRSWDHVDMQRMLSSVLHRVMSGSIPGHRSQHSPWQPGLCISMGISAVEELCQSGSSLHAPQTVTRPACCASTCRHTCHEPRSGRTCRAEEQSRWKCLFVAQMYQKVGHSPVGGLTSVDTQKIGTITS